MKLTGARNIVVEQINDMMITTDEENNLERNSSDDPNSPDINLHKKKSLKHINDPPFEYLIAVKIPVKRPIRQKTIKNRVVFLCSLIPSKKRYLTPPIRLKKLFMVYYIRFYDSKLQNFTMPSSNQYKRHSLLLGQKQIRELQPQQFFHFVKLDFRSFLV